MSQADPKDKVFDSCVSITGAPSTANDNEVGKRASCSCLLEVGVGGPWAVTFGRQSSITATLRKGARARVPAHNLVSVWVRVWAAMAGPLRRQLYSAEPCSLEPAAPPAASSGLLSLQWSCCRLAGPWQSSRSLADSWSASFRSRAVGFAPARPALRGRNCK